MVLPRNECEDNASADVAKYLPVDKVGRYAVNMSADNPPKPNTLSIWRRRIHKGARAYQRCSI
jgi:hypothetical protein